MGKKRNAPVGLSRVSRSLGAADPRTSRNAQMALNPEVSLNKSLEVDRFGRNGVRKARKVANLQPEATLEDVVNKLNELLQSQRDVGQMDGGR